MDLSQFLMAAAIVFLPWILFNAWLRSERLKRIAEFNNRLFDRLGSGKDFVDFLQTEGGARFMENLATDRGSEGLFGGSSSPKHAILRAMQTGIVFFTLGGGLTLLSRFFENHETLTIIGVIALSLGVGFLISTVASYRMARTLGVLEEKPSHNIEVKQPAE